MKEKLKAQQQRLMEVQNKLKDARLVHRLMEAQYNSQEENARMVVKLSRELNQ